MAISLMQLLVLAGPGIFLEAGSVAIVPGFPRMIPGTRSAVVIGFARPDPGFQLRAATVEYFVNGDVANTGRTVMADNGYFIAVLPALAPNTEYVVVAQAVMVRADKRGTLAITSRVKAR